MEKNLKKLFKSIGTGIGTKGIGFALQILGMPIVAHQLGHDQFALFLIAIGIPSFILLAQIGAGPSLTRRVAAAESVGNWADVNSALTASLAISIALSTAIFLFVTVGIKCGLITFFSRLPGSSPSFESAIWVAAMLSCAGLVLTPFARAQVGLHEAYINNMANAVGGIFSLLMLTFILPRFPTIPVAIVSYYGGSTVGSVTGSALFVFRHRKSIRVNARPKKQDLKEALGDGISFTCFEGAQALSREGGKLMLLKGAGSMYLANFGALSQLAMIFRAFVLLVVGPSLSWLTQIYVNRRIALCRKILFYAIGFFVLVLCMSVPTAYFMGGPVYGLIYPNMGPPSPMLLTAAATFAAAACYKSVIMLYSTALKKQWDAAYASVAEAVAVLVVLVTFYSLGMLSAPLVFFVNTVAILIVSGGWLTRRCLGCLHE